MPAIPFIVGAVALSGAAAAIGTVAATIVGATISTAAATAIGTGLVAGTLTAIQGGSVSDVLKSAVVGGVATYVGGYVGDFVGSSVASATGSTLAGNIVGNVASGLTQGVIRGQDLGTALLGGAAASIGALFGEIPGFSSLPKSVQSAITATASAGITGQDIPTALAGSFIQSTGIISSAISSIPGGAQFLESNKDAAQLVTGTLSGALSAALTGKNIGEAAKRGLINASANVLRDQLVGSYNNTQVRSYITDAKSDYAKVEKYKEEILYYQEREQFSVDAYNKTVKYLQGFVTEYDTEYEKYLAVKAKYDAGDRTYATTNELNGRVINLEGLAKTITTFSEAYKPVLEERKAAITAAQNDRAKSEVEYKKWVGELEASSATLGKAVGALTDDSNKAFVTALDPNFKADEYLALNKLPAGTDVYEHYLSTGLTAGMPTNNKSAEVQVIANQTRLVDEVLIASGVDPALASAAQINKIISSISSAYGTDVTALRNATAQEVIQGNRTTLGTLVSAPQYNSDGVLRIDVSGVADFGGWNPPENYTPPPGTKLATKDEFNSGTAQKVYMPGGNTVWITSDNSVTSFDTTTGQLVAPDFGGAPTEVDKLITYGTNPDTWKGTVSQYVLDAAKATLEWAQSTGNSTLINTAANAIKAGGGFLESINGISVLAGYAPKDTALGKFADALQGMGKAGNTAEYQAAIRNMQSIIGDAKGVGGTLKAIYGAFKSAPLEFLAEYVGVEGIQEIAPLLIGGVAAGGAKGAALALKYGEAVAARIGTGAGLSAAMTTDIIESAGGSAKSAYDEAFATARRAGKSITEADKIALDVAQRSALVAAGVTAVSMGLGGAAVERALLGRTGTGLGDALQSLGDFAKSGAKITIREGVAEAGEEGIIQAYLEGQLYKLDPTRDVAGNITAAAAFGAIAGGPIAGGAYGASRTGDVISNALLANPIVADTINNAPDAATAAQQLNNLGVSNATTQANLLNTKFDSAYTSSDEAQAALAQRGDFTYSAADINALTGATSDINLANAVEQYVDPRVLDIQEVKAAAAAEGYTLSDEEAAALVGQKDEAAATTAARAQFDPLATTYDEAKSFFASQGYTPSEDEIRQFVDSKTEADQTKAVTDYVDPRQVTVEEVRKYLTDLGYTGTDAEVNQFVGQLNEAEQAKNIDTYVDPRVVDESEVKAAYAALGLKRPASEDIKKLMGQYAETDLAGKAEASLPTARYNSIIEQLDALADGTQIGGLQATVGQKATPATQADLDAVINLLQQQGTYDPQYDYNGDRVIDQKDKTAIETVLRSQQPDYKPDPNQPFRFAPAAGTKWAATGVYGDIAANQLITEQAIAAEAERTRAAQEQEAARTRAAQEQAALKTQRLGNLNTMMSMLGQAGDIGGQQVTVKAADPAKIGYIYDWSSIFANPAQQQFFASPFAQGGAVRSEVDDVNEELLKILRG